MITYDIMCSLIESSSQCESVDNYHSQVASSSFLFLLTLFTVGENRVIHFPHLVLS